MSSEQPTRRKPGRPPKPGTKPWLLELAPDVAALVEAHQAERGGSRTGAVEDLVRRGANVAVQAGRTIAQKKEEHEQRRKRISEAG